MNDFFETYHELLYNCNKPYQYVGGEFLSRNKKFPNGSPNSANVTVAFAFPDKYEIGISNLGQRILYGLVNDNPDFMADRIYAPEVDFKENLFELKKDFYTLESKTPLKKFDLIGFSLQYELSYPTVLAMMEMGGIAPRAHARAAQEDAPIILAGGPCAYNPLPIADFIDAFLIGDGEEVILEVCEVIKRAKASSLSRAEKIEELSKLEGVWVPALSSPPPLRGRDRVGGTSCRKIKKRIVQIDYDNALRAYPIPFSTSVHDRATVEIRRGCGRMCRFCQPGHVNLPVRERSAEDIIKIAKELVKNTGYDEYSLLSLSSNDYANIKEVIKELSVDFDEKKISASLPSQRIDGFNLELANLVQSVRKSTMTLAPEAGSQRLRDVIRKNITEEQIIDAALTLYENGWARIKLYFIVGLPTETYEDLDEMAKLLDKIRYKAKLIKHEKGLKHSFDLTCTLSIFVPKPFTPFQWCGQMNIDEVMNRIYYLKDKTKHIKGLKINYHDKFVSQIESVLTRGDEKLCDYIEKLWEKGCYLDAWGEHFDKDVWRETAEELGISLSELAEREFSLESPLPWDFIDIGVEKEWLANEYKTAMSYKLPSPLEGEGEVLGEDTSLRNSGEGLDTWDYKYQPSCETGCVNCGVCKNFKTRKVMAESYQAKCKVQNAKSESTHYSPFTTHSVKYRLKLTKTGILRYFSHLDWQNTFLKSLSRSGLNVAYSQGFNPSMKVSLGVALPLFVQSECELVDIELIEDEKQIISLIGNELGEFDNEKDLRKAAIEYYKKNIQRQTVEHSTLGKIEFTGSGIRKTRGASADLRKLKMLSELINLTITADYAGVADIYKPRKDNFHKFYYLRNKIEIDKKIFEFEIIIGENDFGKRYYDIRDIKIGSSTLSRLQNQGVNEPIGIINDLNEKFNPCGDFKIKNLQLKLEKVLPVGCKILEINKVDKSVKAIDNTVQWAQYEIKLFEETLHKFSSLRYNMDIVLSSDEILLTKKNKKGILKTINVKPAINSYEFTEKSLFIVLKAGQGDIPALRADDLMKIVAPDILFDITRTKFFDENVKEI